MFGNRGLLYLTLGFAVGAFVFWSPIIGAFWLFGSDWGEIIAALLFTFFLPVFCCFVLEALTLRCHRPRLGIAVAMVLGIWATGPVCMLLAGTRETGEGFHMIGAWSSVGQMTAIFPISTFMMATYYGSLFALQLTTVALPIFSITRWSFRPLIGHSVVRH
jgi:hypothetical protein